MFYQQSRIETPNTSKIENKETKFATNDVLEESFMQKSPLYTSSPYSYKSMTPLEQRVNEFEKTANYMIRKLEQTKQQIQNCGDGPAVIEHMKLSIAPDAATLISQGDTLILETHGKSQNLSHRLIVTQTSLRDKYKEVQSTK